MNDWINRRKGPIALVLQTLLVGLGFLCAAIYFVGHTERARNAEQEAFFYTLSDLLAEEGIAYWQWDMSSTEVLWSPHLLQVFNTHGSTVRTYDEWLSIVHPDDRERADRICTEAALAGESYSMTYRIIGGDGEIRHIFERGEPSPNQDLLVGLCVLTKVDHQAPPET